MSKLYRIGEVSGQRIAFVCTKAVDYFFAYFNPTFAGQIKPGEILIGEKVLNPKTASGITIPLAFYFIKGGKDCLCMFDVPEKFGNYFKVADKQANKQPQVGEVPEEVDGYPTVIKQKVISLGDKSVDEIYSGEMDLLIARERLKIERDIVAKVSGIGSLKAQKYQDSIDTINDALSEIHGPDAVAHMACIDQHITEGRYSNANRVMGIGDLNSINSRRAAIAASRKRDREAIIGKKGALKKAVEKVKTKTGNLIKKAAEKVKQGVKAVTKVLTAPQRLAAKAILEVTLPKAAPFFLYLFINDPALIAKLPEKARKKRKKAEKLANFIVDGIGMQRNHFMGIVRNGIMKQTGKSPETIIAAQIAGKKISGIGDIYTAGFSALIEIVGKIISLFGKKKTAEEEVTTADAPSDDDFAGMSEQDSKTLASDVKKQTDSSAFDKDTNGGRGQVDKEPEEEHKSGGRKVWKSF